MRCEDWPLTSSLLCDEMDAPAYPRSEMGTADGVVLGFERGVTRQMQFADPTITISKNNQTRNMELSFNI